MKGKKVLVRHKILKKTEEIGVQTRPQNTEHGMITLKYFLKK